jgi:hypothetical protein
MPIFKMGWPKPTPSALGFRPSPFGPREPYIYIYIPLAFWGGQLPQFFVLQILFYFIFL